MVALCAATGNMGDAEQWLVELVSTLLFQRVAVFREPTAVTTTVQISLC
jgi:hypothetical protein